ncbi:hypothetical protein [Aeromonas salmonicida]|uniref:hypothetical protein n=1 Tax=Aeromonas salmonicida TaxID=645 RepID=UPI0015E08BC8|nr:hypothetical protein [Aeromonas salmonicida]
MLADLGNNAVKRFTHDADLRGMVVLRSLGFQLVPFKLHRFRKQRPTHVETVSHRADKHRVTERPLVTVGRRSNAVILHNLTLLNNDANVRIAIKQW